MLLVLLGLLGAGGVAARAQGRGGGVPPGPQVGQVGGGRGLAPLRLERGEGGASGRELLPREGLGLLHEGGELVATGEAGEVGGVALLGRVERGRDPGVEGLALGPGQGREAGPLLARALERGRDGLALGALEGRHEVGAGLGRLRARPGLALVGLAGLLVGAPLGLLVVRGRGGSGRGRGGGRLPGLEPGPGPAGGRARLRLVGDGLQGLRVGQPVHGGHRDRLLLDLQGQRQQGRPVLDAPEGEEARRGVLRVPHHRGEELRVGERPEGGLPGAGERGGLGHRREVARLADARDRRLRRRLVPVVDREVREAAFRLVPHARVGVGGRDPGEHGGLGEPLDGRPADPGIGVLAGEGEHDVVLGAGRRSTASARTAGSALCHSGLLRNRSMRVFRVVSAKVASGPPTILQGPRGRPPGGPDRMA